MQCDMTYTNNTNNTNNAHNINYMNTNNMNNTNGMKTVKKRKNLKISIVLQSVQDLGPINKIYIRNLVIKETQIHIGI